MMTMVKWKDVWIGEIHSWEHERGDSCIVMGHGFGAVKDMLMMYAEKFGEHFSLVLFDYRHFGRSKGEPRQLIDVRKQLEDWRSAVEYAKSKYKRVAIWGSSFSGGHVLMIASERDVDAVVAQVPLVDGMEVAKAMRARGPRFMALGLLDLLLSPLGGLKVPIAGDKGLLPSDYLKVVEDVRRRCPWDVPWENYTYPRVVLSIPFYRPIKRVDRIKCPVFYLVAEDDAVTPPGAVLRAAERTKRAEVMKVKGGHFDVYLRFFDEASDRELEFLRRYLG